MTAPRRVRRAAVEFEAVQWTGENVTELESFAGDGFKCGPKRDAHIRWTLWHHDYAEPRGLSLYLGGRAAPGVGAPWMWLSLYPGEWVLKGPGDTLTKISETSLDEYFEAVT